MYNSNDLSYDALNSSACPHCGKTNISYEETATAKKTGITYPILGWLFTIVSLVFVPILFGALAFSMGILTYYARGRAHGTALMVVASFCLIIGSLFSLIVAGTVFI